MLGNENLDQLLANAARALLTSASQSWTAVTGELRTWRDESLVSGNRAPNGGSEFPVATTWRTEYRFYATRRPWRLRLDRIPLQSKDEQCFFDTAIIHNQSWWMLRTSSTGIHITSNAGRENRKPKQSIGCMQLDYMLHPAAIASAFNVSDATSDVVNGRPVIVIHGVLREPHADFYPVVGGLIVFAATDYAAAVDAEYGIVLRFDAMVGGLPAQRHELADIAFDRP